MNSSEPGLVSRTSIIILSSVLIGMGAGGAIGREIASLCGYAGLLGLACFCALHLVADFRATEHNDQLSTSAATRLSKHRSGMLQLLNMQQTGDRADTSYTATVATSADPRAQRTAEAKTAR
jgi:hypothetical protein